MSERQTPENNRAQNRQFERALQEAERQLGKRLSRGDRRRIHDEITGQDLSYDEIVNLILALFEDKNDGDTN